MKNTILVILCLAVLAASWGVAAEAKEKASGPEEDGTAGETSLFDDIRKEGCTGVQYNFFLNTRDNKLYAEMKREQQVLAYYHAHGGLGDKGYSGPTYADMQRAGMLKEFEIQLDQLVVSEEYIFALDSDGFVHVATFGDDGEVGELQDPDKFDLDVYEYMVLNEDNALQDPDLTMLLAEQMVDVMEDLNLSTVPHSAGYFHHTKYYIGHVLLQQGGIYLVPTKKKKWKELVIWHPTEVYIFFDSQTLEIMDVRIAHCR
ncbi:MAG: hypothetical protein JSV08_07230 [Acidobacteriota bacterium]|nr:MAG: hypothetical protein JSV08_07230 [Acidobacteriota bacterium]